MNRRGTGIIFCLIFAILFSARYIAAAILGSSLPGVNRELFQMNLGFIGTPLLTLSILSLIIGIGYLIWAEVSKDK